ncbi:uncharacterized protein LOC131995952 [Stomoxys calcitrans]|uniref:uncharacterized protein LOC131995952 n=1 Tax=Stomoxys calcitrans TaxID=35570 RepID=UPI0027E2EC0E|nr:uncharacterized protein LOC131995952 [Stomoxys calcitrans]
MYVKVLMQDVWRSKINWDEKISPEIESKWKQWINIIPDIQTLKIPRCYLQHFDNFRDVKVQLHTFVDASKDGYAAVCYFRVQKGNLVICSIVGSKSRVAPIKITSVPRLELMAALIGARFAKHVAENHTLQISQKFYWSDSKTVLSWINSDHRRYQQFVAFRVTEILEITAINDWRWIPSKQNVADDATKWAKTPRISNDSRWLRGPDFLSKSEEDWPLPDFQHEPTKEEQVHRLFVVSKYEAVFTEPRFSKWSRLVRSAAFVLRFICNCRRSDKNTGEFSREELQKAEHILFRQAQYEKYFAEFENLLNGKSLSKTSEIYNKSPYIENGILRVYGRIDNANISREQKRPIILPKGSRITFLLLMSYHEKYYHTSQPQMATLPRARLASFTSPFAYTGMDFFGPILVTVNRHKEKRYGCLFTCLTIRAVHIEVVHFMNTDSYILAFRNFMAPRN